MATPLEIGKSLRDIRRQQELTLKQVEIKSRGVWKAVVVGSYERGSRTLSIEKALRLCQFYGVPFSALTESSQPNESDETQLRIDLAELRKFEKSEDKFSNELARLVAHLIKRRNDWNGHLISLRRSDFETLALMTSMTIPSTIRALQHRRLLVGSLKQ